MTERLIDNPMYQDETDFGRLNYMANKYANPMSMGHLYTLGISPADTVLDLGAGFNTRFGDSVLSTADYIALDANPASVAVHQKSGHKTVLADAANIPLPGASVSMLHARFSLSWVAPEDRQETWHEIIRVGTAGLRGVVMDYDWSSIDGSPAFRLLWSTMHSTLQEFGFDPNYGAKVHQDIPEMIRSATPFSVVHTHPYSRVVPVKDTQEKQLISAITAESIITTLRNHRKNTQADTLQQLVLDVVDEDAINNILPTITSVLFSITKNMPRIKKSATPSVLQPISHIASSTHRHKRHRLNTHPEIILANGDAKLELAARSLFSKVYQRAGYVTAEGLTDSLLNEHTDPAEIRNRSDILVARNNNGEVISTARLVHPNEQGYQSLPTGSKLLKKYQSLLLPPDANSANVAEISGFASMAHDSLLSARLVTAVIEAAELSNFTYVLSGVVKEIPNNIFRKLLGPAMTPQYYGEEEATITVGGPGYRESGIELAAAYYNAKAFYEDMVNYYENSDEQYAKNIINLCRELLSRQENTHK